MRQTFQIVAVTLFAGLLSACAGQGGYGFGGAGPSTPIDRVVFTNGSGQANVFFVAPPPPLGGGQPPANAPFLDSSGAPTTAVPVVVVNATGVKGSQSVVVPDAPFTWTATLNTGSANYYSNAGGIQKPCSPATSPTGNALPDVSPFSATPVIWVQSPGGTYQPLAPQQLATQVFVSPAPVSLVGFGTGKTNYCISLTAVGNGAQATTEIAVTSSP